MEKLKRELAGELAAERFDVTDDGIFSRVSLCLPRVSILAG